MADHPITSPTRITGGYRYFMINTLSVTNIVNIGLPSLHNQSTVRVVTQVDTSDETIGVYAVNDETRTNERLRMVRAFSIIFYLRAMFHILPLNLRRTCLRTQHLQRFGACRQRSPIELESKRRYTVIHCRSVYHPRVCKASRLRVLSLKSSWVGYIYEEHVSAGP